MPVDFLYGLFQLPFWGYALVVFAMIQLLFLAITLFLHREQSHGALVLHPVLRHIFRFWLWYSSGTVTKQWVAVHRRHHVYADKEGDPHSPVVFGLRRVVMEGYELYAVAARDPKILDNYGRGTPDDWIERNLYTRYPFLGIVLFSITQLVLFGVPAILMVAIHLAAQPFCAAGIINGVGHHFGYRSFETESAATNILPCGQLIAGEELHNNHHAFPRSARFSVQPWEFDIGWMWICIFRTFGLVRVTKVAPERRVAQVASSTVDDSTLQALFSNRMHVLRDYAHRVIRPVCRQLQKDSPSGSLPVGISRLLVRHPMLLPRDALVARDAVLEQHEVLRAVMEFRDRLQALWTGASANQTRAVAQLRHWCAQAEESGIRALRDFAESVRRYAPSPA